MKKKALAVLLDSVEKISEEVRELVSRDQLEKASEKIEEFVKELSVELRNDQNINSASIKRTKKNNNLGIIDYDTYTRNRARESQFLLESLSEIPKEIERQLNESQTPFLNIQDTVGVDIQESDFEKLIGGKSQLVKISFLNKAMKASKSVCRVIVDKGKNKEVKGTGFLIEGGFLITNNHVLKNTKRADKARIEFNYEEDESGIPKTIESYELDSSDFLTDSKLDFTRIKVKDPNNSLSKWGALKINTEYIPEIGEPVNIIQHPDGGYKQIALTANEVISNNWMHYLFYNADTLPGSSGSPVFNQDWEVIALHHAGRLMTDKKGGLRINAKGDRTSANRGVYSKYIIEKIDELVKESSNGEAIYDTEMSSNDLETKIHTSKKFFLMYDKADRDQVGIVKKHLFLMERNGKISLYDMHDFSLGDSEVEMKANLKSSDFVLAMVTYNFNYSMQDLVEEAIEIGKPTIPILLNDSDLEDSILKGRRSLPSNGKPIELWDNQDSACVDIVRNLRKVL